MEESMHVVYSTLKIHKWHQRQKNIESENSGNVENKNEPYDIYNYVDIEINNEIEPVNNDLKLMKIMNNKVKISSSELELGEYRYICKITKSK